MTVTWENRAECSEQAVRPHAWQGLCGLYGMSIQGGGDSVFDLSGNGKHGVISGPTWSGNTLYWDSTISHKITTGVYSDAYTIIAHVKPTDETYNCLYGCSAAKYYPAVYLNFSAGKPLLYAGSGIYRYFSADAWTLLKNGDWHWVAFSITGGAQADINNAAMYLDGIPITGDAPVNTSAQEAKVTGMIGKVHSDATAPVYRGYMGDLLYFNYALAAGEIADVAALGADYCLARGRRGFVFSPPEETSGDIVVLRRRIEAA